MVYGYLNKVLLSHSNFPILACVKCFSLFLSVSFELEITASFSGRGLDGRPLGTPLSLSHTHSSFLLSQPSPCLISTTLPLSPSPLPLTHSFTPPPSSDTEVAVRENAVSAGSRLFFLDSGGNRRDVFEGFLYFNTTGTQIKETIPVYVEVRTHTCFHELFLVFTCEYRRLQPSTLIASLVPSLCLLRTHNLLNDLRTVHIKVGGRAWF